MLDVFFLSHGEANADEHWQRLTTLCPRAQRVDGVDGLYAAHQACARASTSENFWVVDADAWVFDDFDFSYVPRPVEHWGRAEKDCVLIWSARNPVNGLEYGYGGIKLFPREPFLDDRPWQLDLSTTIAAVIIAMPDVACETRFNASAESAWIGAFRECAKLSSLQSAKRRVKLAEQQLQQKFEDVEQYLREQKSWTKSQKTNYRQAQHAIALEANKQGRDIFSYWAEIEQSLDRYGAWTRYGWHEKNGEFVIKGARAGARYGLVNSDDAQAMDKINDWAWLKMRYQDNPHA